ncbi:MAG TPA: ABC transporter substrate-binding protein [Candidatus Bathyarchaeia archaeon]|nr:ABC transporter substrate-binding protein [Candidatus Bathyarchaeia archaeon]
MNKARILEETAVPFALVAVVVVSVCAGCLMSSPKESGVVYETWMRSGDMLQQVQTSNIDGFIAWEPVTSKAALSGTGTALAYSHTIWPSHPCCVLVVSRAGLGSLGRNATLAMVWAHIKATRFILDPHNINQTIDGIATSTGSNDTVARESLKHITYTSTPSVQAAREVYDVLENASYVKTNVTALGYASVDQFLNHFVQLDYVNEVEQHLAENPNWTPPPANTTVTLGTLSGDSHDLAFDIAENEGYYASVGLHIVTKQYGSGIDLVEGFKSGEIEMGYCGLAPALLRGVNDGIPMTVIAAVNNEGSALIVNPKAGIDSLSDLAGKTIATPGAGSLQDVLLRTLAQQQHLRVEIK